MVPIFIQALRLYLFSIPAVPIQILPIPESELHYWGFMQGSRPSGFFSEPQAYASFMIPLLVLSLKRQEYKFSYIISLSLIVSTSSLGIIMTGLINLYFLFLSKIKTYQKVSISITLLIFVYLLLNIDMFKFSINKIETTDFTNNIRLTRGFVVYSTFNTWDYIFGISNTLQSYVIRNIQDEYVQEYISAKSENLLGYSNTAAGVFIEFGLIGAIFFWRMLYKMFVNEDKNWRIFLYIIIILSFSQTCLFNAWFVFFYFIYLGSCDKNSYAKNYIILRSR